MAEESEQIKKQKREQQSSTDKIDSFFGSHDFKKEQSNQYNQCDVHATEQLIDKILDNKSSPTKQNESLSPSVEIVEKTPVHHEHTSVEPKQISSNHEDLNKWNPVIESHEKEDIFDLDPPEITKPSEKQKEVHIENSQEKKSLTFFKQNEKPKNNQSPKKNSFSIHLPKLNLKLKKSTKESKIESHQKQQTVEFKEVPHHLTKPLEEKIESETDTINRFENAESFDTVDTPNKKKLLKTNKPKEKKKTSFFKSTDKSHTLFKKKTEGNQSKTETANQESTNQKERKPVQPTSEVNKPSVKVETNQGSVDNDLIQLLKITDDLLGKLPDEVIEEFSQSEDFALYEKVMKKYDILK